MRTRSISVLGSRSNPDCASHRLFRLDSLLLASVDDFAIVAPHVGGVGDGLPSCRAVSLHNPASRFP